MAAPAATVLALASLHLEDNEWLGRARLAPPGCGQGSGAAAAAAPEVAQEQQRESSRHRRAGSRVRARLLGDGQPAHGAAVLLQLHQQTGSGKARRGLGQLSARALQATSAMVGVQHQRTHTERTHLLEEGIWGWDVDIYLLRSTFSQQRSFTKIDRWNLLLLGYSTANREIACLYTLPASDLPLLD